MCCANYTKYRVGDWVGSPKYHVTSQQSRIWMKICFLSGARHFKSAEQRLIYDLFCHYDKEARPVLKFNDSVKVVFEMKLVQVVLVVSQ